MTRAASLFSPIGPAVSSPDADRDCPAGAPDVLRCCRSGNFLPSTLPQPPVQAQQGVHLGGATGCRLLSSLTRIAVQVALTLTRDFASACRPIASPRPTDCALTILPGPRAVTAILSRPAYLRVHHDPRCVDEQSTTERWAWASTKPGQFIQGADA